MLSALGFAGTPVILQLAVSRECVSPKPRTVTVSLFLSFSALLSSPRRCRRRRALHPLHRVLRGLSKRALVVVAQILLPCVSIVKTFSLQSENGPRFTDYCVQDSLASAYPNIKNRKTDLDAWDRVPLRERISTRWLGVFLITGVSILIGKSSESVRYDIEIYCFVLSFGETRVEKIRIADRRNV